MRVGATEAKRTALGVLGAGVLQAEPAAGVAKLSGVEAGLLVPQLTSLSYSLNNSLEQCTAV